MQRKKAEVGRCGRIICPATSLLAARGPERLVGIGFRCWLMGYETGDITCWEAAWRTYDRALGSQDAEPALNDLATWVRAIRDHSRRAIEVYPADRPGFCRDEATAIAMIAACQHCVCPAMQACATALIGFGEVDEVVSGAECFASTLTSLDQVLEPISIGGAGAMFGAGAAPTRRH